MKFPFRRNRLPPARVRVLMVCMGNICRSPMAEGMLRKYLAEREAARGEALPVHVDSAGTHGYHAGAAPDARAKAAAARRGIEIGGLKARQVTVEDFDVFDLVVAMDEDNLAALRDLADPDHHRKLRLLLDFAPLATPTRSVPDPYYGGMSGFERVLDLVEQAMAGLVDEIERLAESRVEPSAR
ncbi:MAG: low molecular weight phosphotyrosine protein phosphatase [Chromatiales bacterium]|nr:low molecular weight phosphotyrosine protein phosphatase [Chromatiales bacterium]